MKHGEKKEVVLMKNNLITKAKFNLSTIENRVFQLVMYKLQKKGVGVLECVITLEEFKTIIKNKNQINAEALSELLVELRKQSIYFRKTKKEQSVDKTSKKPFSVWGEWGIINGHMYDEETASFTIEASEKVHSLLHEYMQGGYTPINLSVFFSLSNSYSQRFYDLLRLWSNKKKVVTYSIDELKELLMVEDKYPRYVDFKRRILNPAINELIKTGMFNIEMKENRKGRAVDSIDFIVTDFDKRIYGLGKQAPTPEVAEEDKDAPKVDKATGTTIIPEETCLVKPLHRLVKAHFKGIDFSEGEYYMAFVESEVATQIQDNVEEITMKEYAYFKATLQNKCDLISKESKINDIEAQLLGY